MLNGKFYTGLPPKMIDRGAGGGRNRLESHLFWPDDTQVDTAVESRIKRQHSVQLANAERPFYRKQNSMADNDVDTKKRFTQEFSQSSIQFYDNLNDNRNNSQRRNSIANKKMEITEKPTNTKMKLPDAIVNEGYTAAKKKQAYTSKIEFYDFVNDREPAHNNRNNLRKPKMDMNDKREMELNSKNSPKLQVKRDVRSLSEEKEQRKLNNRDVRPKNDIHNERKYEENYVRSRGSVEPRISVSPKRGLARATNNRNQRYSVERDVYRTQDSYPYERRKPEYQKHFEKNDFKRNDEALSFHKSERFSKADYENLDDNLSYRPKREELQQIIRNNDDQYYNDTDEKGYYRNYQAHEEMENKMRNVHLRASPQRKPHYYAAEQYYDDEPQHYYDHNDDDKTPTYRGSSNKYFDYNGGVVNDVDLPYKHTNSKINNKIEQQPVATAREMHSALSDAESTVSASTTRSQNHLRSNLCFNNGEIIGENDATVTPTAQKRNARSSATQRVSVGLPD